MASVKHSPGCKTLTACFKSFTGAFNDKKRPIFRYIQQATGLYDRDQALQIAISYERAAKDAASRKWNAMRAESFIGEINAISGLGTVMPEGAKRFFEDWLERSKLDPEKGENTLKNYKCIAADFYEFLGNRCSNPLHEITSPDIVRFRDSERAEGKSVGTVNKALSMLRSVFESAAQRGACRENPVTAGGKITIKRSKKTSQKRSAFTFQQFRELVGALDEWRDPQHEEWKTFVLLVGYTGGRQQEPAKLKWNSVDLEREVLVLQRTKKSDELVLPIHPALLHNLKARRGSTLGDGYVMPEIASFAGQRLSKIFREDILPMIGIVQPYHTKHDNPGKGKGRRVAAFGIHSLRHSLNTWLDAEGVPTATRMRICGHEDTKVSLSYAHPEFATIKSALGLVASVA